MRECLDTNSWACGVEGDIADTNSMNGTGISIMLCSGIVL